MGGLFLLGGFFGGLVLLVPIVLVLGFLVILALRHDDDVDEQRAPAIYGSIIAFVGLVTLLFAMTGVVASLADVTADDTSGGMGMETVDMPNYEDDIDYGRLSSDDNDDAAVSAAIAFFLAGVAAIGVLAVHRSLFERRHLTGGAGRRVYRAYLLVMCFTMAVIAMAAGAATLYQLYQVVAPETSGAADRGEALRRLVPTLVLFVGAGGLWRWHWDELGLRPAVTAEAAP